MADIFAERLDYIRKQSEGMFLCGENILRFKTWGRVFSMFDILQQSRRLGGSRGEMGYRVAAFWGQQYFCCIGGIILVFYNEKKINGIINRHQ